MRTTLSALAANEPRNVVSTKRKRKSPRNPVCAMRLAQTSMRITLRAGMPEPGRFGPVFFGLAGAVAAAEAEPAAVAVDVDAAEAEAAIVLAGIDGLASEGASALPSLGRTDSTDRGLSSGGMMPGF